MRAKYSDEMRSKIILWVSMGVGAIVAIIAFTLLSQSLFPPKEFPWAEDYKVTSPNDVFVKVGRGRPQDYRRLVDAMAYKVHVQGGSTAPVRIYLVTPDATLSDAPNVEVTCVSIAEGGNLTHPCN